MVVGGWVEGYVLLFVGMLGDDVGDDCVVGIW